MGDSNKTLIVRRLPCDLDDSECDQLLRHFGAVHVRCMGQKGSMKNTAFATFENDQTAACALRRLHQLEVLGTRLVVQFSTEKFSCYHPSALEPIKPKEAKPNESVTDLPSESTQKDTEKERKRKMTEQINSLSSPWGFEYPFNPKLQYMYPAPTITILTNIANALATVPKFYVQVLHLMNKMNLPAPFGLPTCTPPMSAGVQPPLPPDQIAPPQPVEEMEYSSTEESELESDGDTKKKIPTSQVKRLRKTKHKHTSMEKKLRLQLQMEAQMQAIAGILPRSTTAPQNPTEVFDQSEHLLPKKIGIKLVTADSSLSVPPNPRLQEDNIPHSETSAICVEASNKTNPQVSVEVGGFGKIEPTRPKPVSESRNDRDLENQEFMSVEELQKGRLSDKEREEFRVFKTYEPGEPSTKLYLKNLGKHTTKLDLHYLYGRYVDWDNEEEVNMYDILMLTGRMKDQAFIQLPNVEKAKTALKETNAFMLNGKPLVVHYSRKTRTL